MLVLDDGKNRVEVSGEVPQKAVNKAATSGIQIAIFFILDLAHLLFVRKST